MMSSTTNPTELKRNLIAVFGTGIVLFLFPLFYLNYLGFLNSYFYVGSPLFYLVLGFLSVRQIAQGAGHGLMLPFSREYPVPRYL